MAVFDTTNTSKAHSEKKSRGTSKIDSRLDCYNYTGFIEYLFRFLMYFYCLPLKQPMARMAQYELIHDILVTDAYKT